VSRRAASASNDPVAAEVAEERIAAGASAQEAVLAAYFACAGADAGVLLSPATFITSGSTAAARCFDGRSRQPGAGAKRPRGHEEADEIPAAARMAVPMGPQSLLVASGYAPSGTTQKLHRPGIQQAKSAGSKARETLLRRVAEVGARAFSEPAYARALFHDADASHGGHLSRADLTQVPPLDCATEDVPADGLSILRAPWESSDAAEVPDAAKDAGVLGRPLAIIALDASGGAAALSFYAATEGLRFAELDLVAPLIAVPVRRGVPRQAPGTALPAPAPIALVADQGRVIGVVASPSAASGDLVRDVGDAPLKLFRQDRYGRVGSAPRKWQ